MASKQVVRLIDDMLDSYIAKANQSLDAWKTKAEDISPTDTGNYRRSFKVNNMKKVGNKLIWSLENDSDYAGGVESGFRKEPVNRHKWPPRIPSTRIFTGVGARVQQRTVDELRQETLQRIFS